MRFYSRLQISLVIPLLWLLLLVGVALAGEGGDESYGKHLGQTSRPMPYAGPPAHLHDACVPEPVPSYTSGPRPPSTHDPNTWQPDPGAVVTLGPGKETSMHGKQAPMQPVMDVHTGMYLPDGRGGYVWVGAQNPVPNPNPNNEAAIEVRLKAKELADQLLGAGKPIHNLVMMPTSLVHQDRFDMSSSFGRYIAEQLIHEFRKRCVRVKEYRLQQVIDSVPGQGDFAISRRGPDTPIVGRGAMVLTGTYYFDKENVFVNARLVRGDDGEVLRTGSLVFAQTMVSKKMLATVGGILRDSYIGVKDYDIMVRGPGLTDIDQGFDIK